jgi:hypothetical protein
MYTVCILQGDPASLYSYSTGNGRSPGVRVDPQLHPTPFKVVAEGLESAWPGRRVGHELTMGIAPREAGLVDDKHCVALGDQALSPIPPHALA